MELLALGLEGAQYDAWLIPTSDHAQFGSGFVAANANSKIPALVDGSGAQPVRVSNRTASCCALPTSPAPSLAATQRHGQMLSWLFLQMGSVPLLGGASVISMPMHRSHIPPSCDAKRRLAREMREAFLLGSIKDE